MIKRNVETQRKTSVSSDSCCLLTRTLWTIVPPLWCFMLFTQIMGPRNCKTRENIKFAILQRARSLAKSGWLSQMVLAYFRDLFAPLSFWEYCGGLNASFQSIKKCHAKNLSSIPWTLQSSWSLKYCSRSFINKDANNCGLFTPRYNQNIHMSPIYWDGDNRIEWLNTWMRVPSNEIQCICPCRYANWWNY